MSCELIRVDFDKGVVKSRTTLDGEKVPYNPYQDEHFKMMTAQIAELCKMAHEHGANPQKMLVAILDEENEFEASMADDAVLSADEQVSGLKRVVAKIAAQIQGPSSGPGDSA